MSARVASGTASGAGPGQASIRKPGGIFDPVARALDLIGERWTLVLVRHLLMGPLGFQELRQRTGIAPRVLSNRLRQLGDKGFVEPVKQGSRSAYALTEMGRFCTLTPSSTGRSFSASPSSTPRR